MSNLRDQLEGIYRTKGVLTPQIVVDVARPENHPLHDRLCWDNDVAGEKYRLIQAHQLIQSVRIKYVTSDRPKDIRAWQPVYGPDSRQPGYEPTEEVLQDDFKRAVLIQQMEREWKTMQARYGDLVEFAEMVRASVMAA